MGTMPHPATGHHAHPPWCASAALCARSATDLAHREVAEPFIPANNPGRWVSVGRVRDDELAVGGLQVTFPSELEVAVQGGRTHLTAREAMSLGRFLVEQRARMLAEETAGGAR